MVFCLRKKKQRKHISSSRYGCRYSHFNLGYSLPDGSEITNGDATTSLTPDNSDESPGRSPSGCTGGDTGTGIILDNYDAQSRKTEKRLFRTKPYFYVTDVSDDANNGGTYRNNILINDKDITVSEGGTRYLDHEYIESSSINPNSNNYISTINNNDDNILSRTPENITTILDSFSSVNGNNSKLYSFDSDCPASGVITEQKLKGSNNNSLDQPFKVNSLTTFITRVTDSDGRIKSVISRTLKRIDGCDYLETTTTTTDLVPLNEVNDDSHLLNTYIQNHFEEFGDNFNVDQSEEHDSTLVNDHHSNSATLISGNNKSNMTSGFQGRFYYGGAAEREMTYNNIDDLLDFETSQDMGDNVPLLGGKSEETNHDLDTANNFGNNYYDGNYNSSDALENHDIAGNITSENGTVLPEDIFEFKYVNSIHKFAVENGVERTSKDNETEERNMGPRTQTSVELDGNNNNVCCEEYQNKDKKNVQKKILKKQKHKTVNNRLSVHHCLSRLVAIDENEAVPDFYDGRRLIQASRRYFVSRTPSAPNESNIHFINSLSRKCRTSKNKKTLVNESSLDNQSSHENKIQSHINGTEDKSVEETLTLLQPQPQPPPPQEQEQQRQSPERQLSEHQRFLLAIEDVRKRYFLDQYDSWEPVPNGMMSGALKGSAGSCTISPEVCIPEESNGSYENNYNDDNNYNSTSFVSSLSSNNIYGQSALTEVSHSPLEIAMEERDASTPCQKATVSTLPYSPFTLQSTSNNRFFQNDSENGQGQINIARGPKVFLSGSIMDSTSNIYVALGQIGQQNGRSLNNKKYMQKRESIESIHTLVSQRELEAELAKHTVSNHAQESNAELKPINSKNEELEEALQDYVLYGDLGTFSSTDLMRALSDPPLDPKHLGSITKLKPKTKKSRHKYLFSRSKIGVKKNKFKIGAIFNKVIQFSGEKRSPQLSKKEKRKTKKALNHLPSVVLQGSSHDNETDSSSTLSDSLRELIETSIRYEDYSTPKEPVTPPMAIDHSTELMKKLKELNSYSSPKKKKSHIITKFFKGSK